MSPEYYWLIVPIFVLLILSGLFSAMETAYSSSSKIRLRAMHGDGNKKAGKVLTVLDRFDSVLSTVLIGNNILNITLTSLSTVLFLKIFYYNETLGSTLSTVIVTIIVVMFGEITPKILARAHPENTAIFYYNFLRVAEIILFPISVFFKWWKMLLIKAFKLKKSQGITEEELVTIVETAEDEGGIDKHESMLIRNAIEFDDLEIKDIMVPRVSVLAFPDNAKADEVAEIFRESGFSRLPMYHSTIDSIIGFIHEKDFNLLYYKNRSENGITGVNFMQIVKPAACVSPTMKVSVVLRLLQRKKQHMAVVVDEFGGTAGIVTMEDIIEELVGEIWDEHDEVEELFVASGGDDYIVNGYANVEEVLEKLDVDVGDFDTISVGGWVIEELGNIPTVGSKFEYQNLEITVLKANARRVLEVKIHVNPKSDEEEDDI